MPKHRSGHYRHQPVNDCRPNATQPGVPVNKAHLPIRNFEQLLDQRDLNSIQL